ncbi:MAG: kynureninase [Bacteroidota bacterium]
MHVTDPSYARQLDQQDTLKNFRDRFVKNDPRLIYLDGNSIGMLPDKTGKHLKDVVEQEWGRGLISSWNKGWYDRSQQTSALLAALIGAQPDEVIICDSTSVNLFKLAFAALKFQEGRTGIVSDNLNFSSDIYLLQGLVELFGHQHTLHLAESHDDIGVDMKTLENLLGEDTALATFSHVAFKSSFMYNMKEVTRLAHKKGALVLWDLSHSTGAVPVDLGGSDADLAIGCTYKYLNGGPGAPAFLYMRKDLQQKLKSPIWGWFGQNNPFDFKLEYSPAPGIERFLAGTPPVLSLSALFPALEIAEEAGMAAIREKSIQQSTYLIQLADEVLAPLGFRVASPRNAHVRGSHVSLGHEEAYRICKALIDQNTGNWVVIPDFREPDNIRLGIAPLYNSFSDIFYAIMEMKNIVEQRWYEKFALNKEKVT